MTPVAKKAVKLMPIAASGLVLLLLVIKPIKMLAIIPVTNAPINIGTPNKKDRATPGNTAWLIASPIRDKPLSTMRQPTVPQTIPTIIEIINALLKNLYSNRCWKNSI